MRLAAVAAAGAAVLALPAHAGNRLQPVPILMYHVVSAPPANAPYPELYVRPADFAGEVGWLAGHGYHAVTLQRVFDSWRGAATLPAKPVVLSFDDG
jgi:peptidoglycan/xylan/chitin deacetylase (PgdA/CDA1 family)